MLGRATAETAALIFTSGYVDRMPASLHDSGRALAVHIYDLSMNVSGGDGAAHGSALVLIVLIVAIHLMASQLSEERVGKLVEFGRCQPLFDTPQHSLTAAYVSGAQG